MIIPPDHCDGLEDVMRLFFLSAVSITVVLLIFFALRAAIRAALWKEFEKTETNLPALVRCPLADQCKCPRGANADQDQKASTRSGEGWGFSQKRQSSSGTAARDNAGSRPHRLRLLRAKQAGRLPYRRKCGPIANTSGGALQEPLGSSPHESFLQA